MRAAERGDKRRILELAERNARLAIDQEKLRSERRRQQRVEALDGLQQALGLDTIPLRIECFDISTLMGTNTVASMVVFEGGAPKKSDYRRFRVRTVGDGSDDDYGPDDFASMEEILGRRVARWESQRDISPHDKDYDPSFAALPNVIVIDGGKGQLAAGMRVLTPFIERGVTVVSLAKRIEEVFFPGRSEPLVLAHDTPELQLLQRVRDEAHRFAITHHRIRRDRAMTASVLDELPGVGPARKRALLAHFGSPDAILAGLARGAGGGAGRPGQARARHVSRAAQVGRVGPRQPFRGDRGLCEDMTIRSAVTGHADRRRAEFDQFVADSSAGLLRTGYLIVWDLAEAEDLVQECLLAVARRWPRVRRMEHPYAYARRILVNLALRGGPARSRRRDELVGAGRRARAAR